MFRRLLIATTLLLVTALGASPEKPALKEAFKDSFLIGAAFVALSATLLRLFFGRSSAAGSSAQLLELSQAEPVTP